MNVASEALERETVPCGICGKPTPMTGTKRCDRCWELEGRIQSDPELARKILGDLAAKGQVSPVAKTTMSKADWASIGTKAGWMESGIVKQAVGADRTNLIDLVMSYGDEKVAEALKAPRANVKDIVGRLSDEELNKLYDSLRKGMSGTAPMSQQPVQQEASLGWTLEKMADVAESLPSDGRLRVGLTRRNPSAMGD